MVKISLGFSKSTWGGKGLPKRSAAETLEGGRKKVWAREKGT